MVIDYDFILELRRIQDELNHLFEQFLSRAEGSATITPGCNIIVCQDKIQVYFELPGCDPGSIRVSMMGQNLIIEGDKRRPAHLDHLRPIRLEREQGTFYRAISIPFPINPHAGKGYWKDGFLIVELPRVKDRRKRKTTIPVDTKQQ